MTMTPEEVAEVVAGVDLAVSARLEAVYLSIDQVRDEINGLIANVRQSVETLDQTDLAIIAKVQEIMEERLHAATGEDTVSGFMEQIGGGWVRYVEMEARRLGLVKEPRVKGKLTDELSRPKE